MYIPEYYKVYELVPRDLYEATEDKAELLYLFDSRILRAADFLRGRFGPMRCNDWFWGGQNHYRGYRPFDCRVGAELSQHKFGRALDLAPVYEPVEKLREALIRKIWLTDGLITCVEATVPWLHIDCRNHNPAMGLMVIEP